MHTLVHDGPSSPRDMTADVVRELDQPLQGDHTHVRTVARITESTELTWDDWRLYSRSHADRWSSLSRVNERRPGRPMYRIPRDKQRSMKRSTDSDSLRHGWLATSGHVAAVWVVRNGQDPLHQFPRSKSVNGMKGFRRIELRNGN